jgi:hypothetical protein
MTDMIRHGDIEIARILHDFVNDEALHGTGVSPDHFWDGAARIINALAPKARALVAERTALQGAIDDWHKARRGQPHDADEYRSFLAGIGYLAPDVEDFTVSTARRRRRDRPHRRPPARRADEQCALFPECRQCPLGLALRRALRHRRHPRDGRSRAPQGVQPAARQEGRRLGESVSRRRRAGVRRQPRRGSALLRRGRTTGGRAHQRREDRPRRSRPVRRLQRRGVQSRRPSCWSTTTCTSMWSSTAPTRSAAPTPPASPT